MVCLVGGVKKNDSACVHTQSLFHSKYYCVYTQSPYTHIILFHSNLIIVVASFHSPSFKMDVKNAFPYYEI